MSHKINKNPNRNLLLFDCNSNSWCLPYSISLLKSYINTNTPFYVKNIDFGNVLKNEIPEKILDLDETERLFNKLKSQNKYCLSNNEKINIQVIREKLKKLNLENFKLIGFSVLTPQALGYSMILSQIIKKIYPRTKIIFGGLLFKSNPEIIFNTEIDYLICNNGLGSLEYLLEKINNVPLTVHSKIGEICFLNNNKIEKMDTSDKISYEEIKELEVIPNFDDFKKKNYKRYIIPLKFIKGCIYNCSFCTYKEKSKQNLEPKKIAYQIKLLNNRYKPDHFLFTNDSLVQDENYFKEFCKYMFKFKNNIKYHILDNCLKFNDEIFSLLKKTGCFRIDFGFENINEKIIKLMKKPHKKDTALKIIEQAKNNGFNVTIYYICGFINEDNETHKNTIEFIKNMKWNKNFQLDLFKFYIHPESDIYKNYKNYGIKNVGIEKTNFFVPTSFKYSKQNKTWPEIKKTNEIRYKELKKIYFEKTKIIN